MKRRRTSLPLRPNKRVATPQLDFYRARADQARADAAEATLAHVRERCERSEAAWTALADRAERGVQMKIAEEQRKAESTIAEVAQ
jgi:hypothetical protein